ncbi:MAG TPA: hypothetical protein VGF82_24105 [Terracidiphilus sp.]|jgi:Flp pilus assembly pilin Flp
MVILHAFLALAAGFITIVLLVAAISALLKRLTPSWTDDAEPNAKPTAGYVIVNLGYSFLAAAAGGYVTALIAGHNPLIHVLALAITVLLLAALSALQQRGKHRIWYLLALVALTPAGVLAGGLVRLRVLGLV